MTATYDITSPTDKDRVRFQIQDTDLNTPRFQDEDIEFALSEGGDVAGAIVLLLRADRVRAAMTPDFTADWLRVESQKQVDEIGKLLADPTSVSPDVRGVRVLYPDRYDGD